MSEAEKRVVVIQDASRNISSTAIKWILHGLQLKPGDTFIFLGVLHQVNTPSVFQFMGAKNLLGCKSGVGFNSIVGVDKEIIKEAIERKMEEYHDSMEVVEIRKLYETNQVRFNIKVAAAASAKMVALGVAHMLRPTWIILDRQMKRDKKYFLEGLSCGISRMKRDDRVEELRGPKDEGTSKMHTAGRLNSLVTYDEMFVPDDEISPKTPGISDNEILPKTPGISEEDDLFSLELSPMKVVHLMGK